MRTMILVAVLLAGCSSTGDPAQLLVDLDGPVACDDNPKVDEGMASCLTVSGDGIVASYQDDDPGFLFALTLDDDSRENIYVWHPGQRWTILAPDVVAAREVSRQLDGDVVTQAYFERNFLDG